MEREIFDDLQKKSKKKKHHRSRSRSEKKHKRSRSRSQRKKDKKKKQRQQNKHKNRSISEQNQKQRENQKTSLKEEKNIPSEKDNSKEITQKQKRKQQLQKDEKPQRRKQKDRESKDIGRKKDKYKQRSDRQYRDRENRDDKIKSEKYRYNKGQIKNEQRSQSRQKRKEKDRSRQREKNIDRDRERQREKERQKNRNIQKQRQRNRQRQRGRERSRQLQQFSSSRNMQRYDSSRRSRTPQRHRQRQQRQRFRFDSPPKSDQSDISDDPQKMEKLNRTKAQQQLVTSKADKKLYLGNLPPNITSQQLMDMLNVALKKMEINTDVEGDSIISAWISPDGVGHYAFVEFRTAQQASNGLALNGASLFGYQLKLGRPKQYIEYNKQMLSKFGTDSSIDTILKKVQAIGGQIELQVSQKIIHPPSRIIVLKHIVTVDQLAIDEEYQQIYDDVKDMAKRFGDVIKIVIPRPHEVIDLQEVQKRVKGLGYIFVQYRTIQQAIFARKQFIQKQFSSRSVACAFFNEKRWIQGEYDICQKVVIDF